MKLRTGRWAVVATLAVLAPAWPAMAETDSERIEERRVHKIVIGDGGSHEVHEVHEIHPHMRFLMRGGGFLGVQLTDLTPELRAHFGVPEDSGVMVSRVVDDSPAFRAGLAVGDIVTAIGGETVGSARDLARVVRGTEDGATVDLEIWRDGRLQTLATAIEVREPVGPRHARRMGCAEGDCMGLPGGLDLDCGDDQECRVQIQCEENGDCTCEVNGEPRDCDEVRGGE